jgi:hypothetical protein
VKRYGKYGRKASRIVIRYGQYGRKASWIVKRYDKYRRNPSWKVKKVVRSQNIKPKSYKNRPNKP